MSIGRNAPTAASAAAVTLQWANGKTMARESTAARFAPLVGFHVEVGQDDDLDHRLHATGWHRIEIKHQREGGAEILPHWFLGESLKLYPVTSGPPAPTIAGLVQRAADTAAAGLGVKWPQGERSRLAVRGYVGAFIDAGYLQPVQLSTRSRMTDVLLGCLLAHLRVAEQADSLVDRTKHPHPVDLHEIALPLAAGEEQEWGKGDTATVVPLRHLHPETVDAAYLREHWRPDAVNAAALRDWEGITAWAAEYAAEGAPA